MRTLIQDVRYALRRLRLQPSFSLLVVLTFALGISAATGIFALVDGALFQSLPYPHAEELVSVGVLAPMIDGEFLFAGSYLSWRHEQKPFAGFTSTTGVSDCDLTENHPVRLSCGNVDADFLPTFGIHPLLGRNFTSDEDRPGAPKVGLLSYGLWQTRFAGSTAIVGQTVSIDGIPTRVVGVLPREFEFPTLARVDALRPEALDESMVQRGELGPTVRVYGRMKPGVGLALTVAQLQTQFREFVESAPPPFRKTLRLQVRPIRDLQIHDSRSAAWLLLIAAMALLLIACANAAGLILAKSARRRRELAVRSAVGASRARLFQQRITESLVLALIGGAAGCGFAWAIVRSFVSLAPTNIPRLLQASINTRVLLFAAFVSISVGVIFGSAPALEKPVLGMLVPTTPLGTRKARLRQALLIAQVGLTVVLLSGALLFMRSLQNLQNEPLGMNTQNVVTAQITLGQQKYSNAASRLTFFEQLEQRLKELPGVSATALSDSLPPTEPSCNMPFIALHAEGQPTLSPEQGIGGVVGCRSVTPGYFAALGISLLRGRAFLEQDRRPGNGAIILNGILARKLFPRQEPLGKIIRFDLHDQHFSAAYTVVGVAGDTQNHGLGGRTGPEYYLVRQHTRDDMIFHGPNSQRISMVARSVIAPRVIAAELRDSVASLDPTIPARTSTLSQTVYDLAQRSRFSASMLSIFAMMGVLLAATGIYGLVSLLVTQCTQEIALRIALGANPAALTAKIVAQLCSWIAFGAAVGILSSLPAAHLIQALLFGITPSDPKTIAEAVCGLLVAAIVAAYIPARRAAKVDPMVALRYE